MPSKKVLVLGAGSVGLKLIEAAGEKDWELFSAARFSNKDNLEKINNLGIKTYIYDVTKDDPKTLPEVDLVFLQVWDPQLPDKIWDINYYGIGKVVQRYAGTADFINGCTINVYGNTADQADIIKVALGLYFFNFFIILRTICAGETETNMSESAAISSL